jgi:hypothetical protein
MNLNYIYVTEIKAYGCLAVCSTEAKAEEAFSKYCETLKERVIGSIITYELDGARVNWRRITWEPYEPC